MGYFGSQLESYLHNHKAIFQYKKKKKKRSEKKLALWTILDKLAQHHLQFGALEELMDFMESQNES